jgi:hypothetical protein
MSYFTLDTNQKLINEDKTDIPMSETPKKNINYARHTTPHTEATKKRISETQMKRNDMIREFVKRGMQKPITEDKVRTICQEVLNEYLDRLTKPNNNRPTNINI